MAQVLINSRSRTPVIAAIGLVAAAAAAAYMVFGTSGDTATPDGLASATTASQAPTSDSFQRQATPEEKAEVESIKAQQAQASAAMESQLTPEPVATAPMTRPDYISDMEWTMLQGVANQAQDPQAELTRLVNSLRFNKQLEMWQDLPADADPSKRATLARALLDDLPERVKMGNFGLNDAKGMAEQMVKDVEPNEAKQGARLKKEHKRLETADSEYRKAGGT
jgi:hypothetical protein